MKKIFVFLLLAVLSNSYADDSKINEERMAWTKAYLEKQGLPVPDGGIKIVPENQMSEYQTFKKQRSKNKKDIAEFGYMKQNDPEAERLFNIKTISSNQFKKYGANYSPTSTHLRHSINDLKMAYTFIGVPQDDMSEFIGVAPYLTYLKGQGWVGAIQFFNNSELGNCSFSENNVKLSHGSIVIAKEDARNDINDKTTTVEVSGTEKNGFVYTVEWFDTTFFRALKCANEQFSQDKINQMIELAKHIDSNNTMDTIKR